MTEKITLTHLERVQMAVELLMSRKSSHENQELDQPIEDSSKVVSGITGKVGYKATIPGLTPEAIPSDFSVAALSLGPGNVTRQLFYQHQEIGWNLTTRNALGFHLAKHMTRAHHLFSIGNNMERIIFCKIKPG